VDDYETWLPAQKKPHTVWAHRSIHTDGMVGISDDLFLLSMAGVISTLKSLTFSNISRVPASEIEDVVVNAIRQLLQSRRRVGEGTGEFSINGFATQVNAGDMVFAESNVLHGVLNTGKTRITFYFIKTMGRNA
jgi:hypothetical protein